MAGGISGRGAFWLGALVGLIFSVGLVAALSIMAPGQNSPEPAAAVAPAPKAETGAAPEAEAEPEPDTAAPTPEVSPAPEYDSAPSPDAAGSTSETTNAPDAPAPTITPGAPSSAPEEADPPTPAGETTTPTVDAANAAPTPRFQKPSADLLPTISKPVEIAPLAGPTAPEGPRFEAYAAPFDGDASKPLLAILLTGAGGADATGDVMLLDRPMAISIAPDAANPAKLATELHAAGYEALAGRTGATAAATLDDAGPVIGVALLDAGLEFDVGAVLDVVAAEEAALVDLTAEGGAALYRMAHSRGLPAASAGRRIDEIASSDMVYQALERAAFDARRTGAFVAVGEASPAVIAGVRRWMSVKAGISVEVAPLSAVIAKTRR